jgi:hypothetical protein
MLCFVAVCAGPLACAVMSFALLERKYHKDTPDIKAFIRNRYEGPATLSYVEILGAAVALQAFMRVSWCCCTHTGHSMYMT